MVICPQEKWKETLVWNCWVIGWETSNPFPKMAVPLCFPTNKGCHMRVLVSSWPYQHCMLYCMSSIFCFGFNLFFWWLMMSCTFLCAFPIVYVSFFLKREMGRGQGWERENPEQAACLISQPWEYDLSQKSRVWCLTLP